MVTILVMGLLLSGILKAQGLIDVNKAQRLEDDFRNISLYINEYQSKFKALPSDDPTIGSAHSHLGNAVSCTAAITGKCSPGNGIIDGNWNDATAESESFIFWQHIRLAGLVSGDTDITSDSYPAKNVAGGSLGIASQSASPIVGLKGEHIVCSDGIPGRIVKQIEIALDDGNTAAGSMMTTFSGTTVGGTAIATNLIVDDDLHLVCMVV